MYGPYALYRAPWKGQSMIYKTFGSWQIKGQGILMLQKLRTNKVKMRWDERYKLSK